MQILILLLNVFMLFNYSNSQIIQLFNKYHLYEFQSSQVKVLLLTIIYKLIIFFKNLSRIIMIF